MSANLTPQYFKAEERYKNARDDEERLAALREMLQTVPKHKGTEKIQADLKKRIAQLRQQGGDPRFDPDRGCFLTHLKDVLEVGEQHVAIRIRVVEHDFSVSGHLSADTQRGDFFTA